MDLFLLIIAIMAQNVMCWMGFVVSTRPPANPRFMEAIFIVCAIVGTVVLISIGVRSNSVQDDIQSTLHRIESIIDGNAKAEVAIPVRCGPHIARPSNLMTREQIKSSLARAKKTDDMAKIVSEQLSLWLQYGPKLEAVAEACGQSADSKF